MTSIKGNNSLDSPKTLNASKTISVTDITAAGSTIGEVKMAGDNRLGLYVDFTANESVDVTLDVVALLDGVAYTIDSVDASKTITEGKTFHEFDVGSAYDVRVRVAAATVGATTPGALSVSYSIGYRA